MVFKLAFNWDYDNEESQTVSGSKFPKVGPETACQADDSANEQQMPSFCINYKLMMLNTCVTSISSPRALLIMLDY